MSVLCTSLLKESIRNSEIQDSAQMLNFVRSKLIETFKTNEHYSLSDGMDLSMCVVDRASQKLDYCGANRPLFMFQKGEIIVIRGNKQSVGFNYKMKEYTYNSYSFNEGDVIYLFSDGIVDQFGGPKYKKFMTARFKKAILRLSDLPIEDQINNIKNDVLEWKGELEQTDDICVMGVKL